MLLVINNIFQKTAKIYLFTFILILIILVLFHDKSYARWKTKNDVDIQYIVFNHNINVFKDGTYEIEVEERQRLIREGGRKELTKYMLSYMENLAAIEIVEAKTINNGKEYTVEKSLIEDKPLASEAYSFDQVRQISIPFKKIQIGSEIYLKYKYKAKKVPLTNHFSMFFTGDAVEYFNKNAKTTITSSIPLYTKVHDPKKVLKVINNSGNKQVIEIKIIKPFTDQTIDEKALGLLNPENKTWISISSEKNWDYIGKSVAKRYNGVIKQKLPKKFEEIVQKAQLQKTDIDKINIVTSELQKYLQYLGDWKTIDGMIFPRDLKIIDSTQYGDCKDFAVATATMLNQIGFKARAALVNRGYLYKDYLGSFPGMNIFNHAIVYAQSKAGKEYWVDPTNIVSMSDGIFPDISNRKALVLDNINPVMKMIPEIKFNHAASIYSINLELKDDKLIKTINVKMKGEQAMRYTGLGLYESKESIEDIIMGVLEDNSVKKLDRITVKIPELKNRIVNDIDFNLKYIAKYPYIKTNYGQALDINDKGLFSLREDIPDDSVKDYYLGFPRILQRTVILDKKIENTAGLNFKIQSPWINVERIVKIENNNTYIIDKVIIKRSYITYKERNERNYKDIKNTLEKMYNKVMVIINKDKMNIKSQ